MHTQNKISVVIITGNEENNIKDCLKSVTWADEIIVVDSESTDETVNIAKEFTDQVYKHKWQGYSAQKSLAISYAKNEWVVSLDADERVSKALADEIINFDLQNTKFAAFKMKRENYFMGKKINYSGWGNDFQLRLFRKSKTTLNKKLVHERFIVEGTISELKNSILHYSYVVLEDGFNKINKYSSLEAEEKYKRNKITVLSIVLYPITAFLQHYFIRLGILDGKHGLIISLMHAITKLQVQMKIWELQNKNKAFR